MQRKRVPNRQKPTNISDNLSDYFEECTSNECPGAILPIIQIDLFQALEENKI